MDNDDTPLHARGDPAGNEPNPDAPVSGPPSWLVGAAAALGVGAAAATLALPAGIAWAFTHPPRRLHLRTPRALHLHFHRVRLLTQDGVRLSAWHVPVNKARVARGLVVVCHGYYGNRAEMLPHLAFLHAAGYEALLLDFRAHGWSGGRLTTFGVHETLDVRAALDWVGRQPTLRELPLALLGESMGAAVCLLVAAADTRVRAVVSDAAFARFDSAVEGRLRTILGRLADPVIPPAQAAGERLLGVRCIEIAPEEAIAKIAPRPVLLIHGGRDRLIRVENAYRLLRAARKNPNNRVSLWEVPSAGHVASIRLAPDEYARRVLTFLEMALTPFPLRIRRIQAPRCLRRRRGVTGGEGNKNKGQAGPGRESEKAKQGHGFGRRENRARFLCVCRTHVHSKPAQQRARIPASPERGRQPP
jgi:fermentation-respiration switch protein FrsA (DUF1100 family)